MTPRASGGSGRSPDPRHRDLVRLIETGSSNDLWYGGATVLGSLRGVDAEQAAWRPAPGRHSIWALALHIAYWEYAVRRHLTAGASGTFPRSPSNFPQVPDPPSDQAWLRDRSLLGAERKRLLDAVRSFDATRLDDPVPGSSKWTFADLLYGVVMHDTYHVGQIQMLKRLYAATGGQTR